VTSQPWAGIEWHETKRLCFGRFDHFPNVDPHGFRNELHLVYHCDIYAPENVFSEFYHLSGARIGHHHDLFDEYGIKGLSDFTSFASVSTHHFGDRGRREVLIAWVFALR